MNKFNNVANICRMFGFSVFYTIDQKNDDRASLWFMYPKGTVSIQGAEEGFIDSKVMIKHNNWLVAYFKDITMVDAKEEPFHWLCSTIVSLKEKMEYSYELRPFEQETGDGSRYGVFLDDEILEGQRLCDEKIEQEYAARGSTRKQYSGIAIGDAADIESAGEEYIIRAEKDLRGHIEAMYKYLLLYNEPFKEYIRIFGEKNELKFAFPPKYAFDMGCGSFIER